MVNTLSIKKLHIFRLEDRSSIWLPYSPILFMPLSDSNSIYNEENFKQTWFINVKSSVVLISDKFSEILKQ